ncbi:integrase [Lachnoclostridium sp. An118]|nr:integrase [Lachnoclostridium sp. An118]
MKGTVRNREYSLERFQEYLQERENSQATIGKYLRDVRKFFWFMDQREEVDKEVLMSYKQWLIDNYSVSSVNSMIAALNQYLVFADMERLRLKRVRVQRMDIQYLEKELKKGEFQRLVRKARGQGKEQIAMIMETMCATGIRVSELKFFRVDNVKSGIVKVWNKGKCRLVILPALLRSKLLLYISRNRIRAGIVFRTRTGRAKDRSNIWREMKDIAAEAGIGLKKVFPHNLRHLFARTFYKETKNLLNLADILGHSSLEVTRIYASDGLTAWKKNLERIKLLETT